jgi:MinD-like ATPase involved in chromosome partitioning or flagellar assembly
VRLSEAPSHGQPIMTYSPTSPGSVAYRALANELIARNEIAVDQASDEQNQNESVGENLTHDELLAHH